MTYFLLTFAVVLSYGWLTRAEYHADAKRSLALSTLTVITLLAHAYLLHHRIDLPAGQNLSVSVLFCLIAWLAAVILEVGRWRLAIGSLGLLVYPIAAVSLGWMQYAPGYAMVVTGSHPWALFHILLATLVVGLFAISGAQAVLLALQERLLRRKPLSDWVTRLPSLQLMESVLFTLVKWGVWALSLLLVSSFFLLKTVSLPGFWSKLLLACCVWLVFSGLLIGRHFLGWRGTTAVAWTVSGVLLSMIVYLGSHFILLL